MESLLYDIYLNVPACLFVWERNERRVEKRIEKEKPRTDADCRLKGLVLRDISLVGSGACRLSGPAYDGRNEMTVPSDSTCICMSGGVSVPWSPAFATSGTRDQRIDVL